MSLNFSRRFLPFTPSYKRTANWKSQTVTIPNLLSFIRKIRSLKQHHNINAYNQQWRSQDQKKDQVLVSQSATINGQSIINNIQKSEKKKKKKRILQLVTDFDYTITKHMNPFENYISISDVLFSQFGRSLYLPQKFKQQLVQNYLRFGPYQTDNSITFQQRAQLINQLYKIQLSLFKKHFITYKMIEKVTEESKVIFRSYSKQLFRELFFQRVPVYIISGAVSDMIQSMIRGLFYEKGRAKNALQDQVLSNISIHSNQLQQWHPTHSQLQTLMQQNPYAQFNDEKFVKFKKHILHSYNRFNVMKELPFANPQTKKALQQQQKENTVIDSIVLGDLISDFHLSRQQPSHQSLTSYRNSYQYNQMKQQNLSKQSKTPTKLSFFYAKYGQTDQRALAQQKFDVIIEGDGSHRMLIEIIKIIRGDKDRVDWNYLSQTHEQMEELIRWI